MLRKTSKERIIKKLKNKKGGKEKNTGRSKNKDKEEKI